MTQLLAYFCSHSLNVWSSNTQANIFCIQTKSYTLWNTLAGELYFDSKPPFLDEYLSEYLEDGRMTLK